MVAFGAVMKAAGESADANIAWLPPSTWPTPRRRHEHERAAAAVRAVVLAYVVQITVVLLDRVGSGVVAAESPAGGPEASVSEPRD